MYCFWYTNCAKTSINSHNKMNIKILEARMVNNANICKSSAQTFLNNPQFFILCLPKIVLSAIKKLKRILISVHTATIILGLSMNLKIMEF